MSKKRKKNRPKNRPSSRRAEKQESPKTLSRRKLLWLLGGTGGAAVAAVAASRWGIFGETPREENAGAKPMKARPSIEQMPHAEWLSSIKLPDMKLIDGKVENIDSIDDAQAEKFMKLFISGKEELLSELDKANSFKEREDKIIAFLGSLLQFYHHDIVAAPESLRFNVTSREFFDRVDRCNRVLAPRGHFLMANYSKKKRTQAAFFEVQEEKKMQISLGGQTVEIPFYFVHNQKNANALLSVPSLQLNGQYYPEAELAVFHPQGNQAQYNHMAQRYAERCHERRVTPRIFDEEKSREDMRYAYLLHEGAHAALDSFGVIADPFGHNGVHKRGRIFMGEYNMTPDLYENASNGQLHELIANGYSLMNSGEAAPLVAHAIVTASTHVNYQLAQQVIWREIATSPALPEAVSKSMVRRASQSIDVSELITAINGFPLGTLHSMGERMARLGLYLVEK